ncbi:hypothetical protein BC828DRAFT_395597 [Blastocladiella britannica]|nr:hypothetical protein BC828DRAFT_395597 [Blastocladiella britannica]
MGDFVPVPLMGAGNIGDAAVAINLEWLDILPDQQAMVAAMLAKESVAFTPIQFEIERTVAIQFGANGPTRRARADPGPRSLYTDAVCPIFIDVSAFESGSIVTALAFVAASNNRNLRFVPNLGAELGLFWPRLPDDMPRIPSRATLVVCPRLLMAQWVAQAHSVIFGPIIAISNLAELKGTSWAALSTAELVIVAKELLLHSQFAQPLMIDQANRADFDAAVFGDRPPVPGEPMYDVHKKMLDAACSDVARILDDGAEVTGPMVFVAPFLDRYHWRRAIAHKLPSTISDPRPNTTGTWTLLSNISAGSWLSVVPPPPRPDHGRDDLVPLAHVKEAMMGAVITGRWGMDLPDHAAKRLVPFLVCCCLGLNSPAAPFVPPAVYTEVPIYLSEMETVVLGLTVLINPVDDGFAVRAAQHHHMVRYEVGTGGKDVKPLETRYWFLQMASQSNHFLRRAYGLDPLIGSMLSASMVQLQEPPASFQTSHGLTVADLFEWLDPLQVSDQELKKLREMPRKVNKLVPHGNQAGKWHRKLLQAHSARVRAYVHDFSPLIQELTSPLAEAATGCKSCGGDYADADVVLLMATRPAPTWQCQRCQGQVDGREAVPRFMCQPRQSRVAHAAAIAVLEERQLGLHRIAHAQGQYALFLDKVDVPTCTAERVVARQAHLPTARTPIAVTDFMGICGSRVTQLVCHVARLLDSTNSIPAKVVIFCEYLQQINLLHDALTCAGVRCTAVRHGIHTYYPLQAFKVGLAPGTAADGQPIDTAPALVLIMPYSACDYSLELTEATHVVLSHPYVGPDTAVKYEGYAPGCRLNNKEWGDAKRAEWSNERWRVERLKWREIERLAVGRVVLAGQANSVQVTRFYAAHTREAEIAMGYGDPLDFHADEHTIAALEQDKRDRFPKDWTGSGVDRLADAVIYSYPRRSAK